MKRISKLNLEYIFVQGLHWMLYGATVSFATIYLQGLGYSNSELGLIMAAGHITGFLLSNFLGTLIDKGTVKLRFAVNTVLPLVIVFGLINSFIRVKTTFTFVTYPLFVAFSVSVNSLILKIWTDFQYIGDNINFGLARGLASFFFFIFSTFTGKFVESKSIFILPYLGIAFASLQIVVLNILIGNFNYGEAESGIQKTSVKQKNATGFIEFYHTNKTFFLLLLGLSIIFLSHYMTSSYLINIIRKVGGNAQSYGNLNAYIALLEVPTLMLYKFYKKKFKSRTLISIAVIFFTLKSIGIALSDNITALYLVHLMQIPSYAVYMAAIVDYVKDTVAYKDSAKGQSLSSSMTTLGSVGACIFGGIFYDKFGVTVTTFIAVAFSALGTIICLAAINKSHIKIKKSESI